MASDSAWVNMRHGVFGGVPGLGYDYLTGQGFWEEDAPYQVNYDAMPKHPEYRSIYDPFSMSVAGINADTRGLEKFRSEALRTGPSTWAELAEAKSRADESMARGGLQREAAANTATARSNLAMRGGLRGGARERLEMMAGRDAMDASRRLSESAGVNRMQIGINDERNRVTQLGMLPGMEVNQAQFDVNKKNMDVNRQLEENRYKNNFEMERYKTATSAWAAGEQANSTAASADDDSWLCTLVGKWLYGAKGWDFPDREILSELRRFAIKKDKQAARFYFGQCHQLAKIIEAQFKKWEGARNDLTGDILFIMGLVDAGELAEAYDEYERMTLNLLKTYWPGGYAKYLDIKKGAA